MCTVTAHLSAPTALALLILYATLLTGCASSAPQPVVVALHPPSTICAADPVPPARDAPAADFGAYVVALWQAGDDCRRKLRAVNVWASR